MSIEQQLISGIQNAFKDLYEVAELPATPALEPTKKEFAGDYTFVVFPYLKLSKKNPEQTANDLGEYLTKHLDFLSGFNVIKGFLNLEIGDTYWLRFLNETYTNTSFGKLPSRNSKVMVEYSSPNTNKPLHLGHIRNNLLGYSVAEILAHGGYDVIKANLINDRGIHICKSMIAWMKFGNGETPQSSGIKGDHLVGKYYVEFDKAYKEELNQVKILAHEAFKNQYIQNIEFDAAFKKVLHNIELTQKQNAQKNQIIQEAFLVGVASASIAEALGNKEKQQQGFGTLLIGAAIGLMYHGAKSQNISNEIQNRQNNLINQIDKTKQEKIKDFVSKLRLRMTSKEIIRFQADAHTENEIFDNFFEKYKEQSVLLSEAQELLLKWEQGDEETLRIWKMMNGWVYDGFDVTYKRLGVNFDKFYYESNTYLLGKDAVKEGLDKGVFYQKDDGSIWIDLTEEGLDHKLLQRSDGTSVYITQDIGTAQLKYDDYHMDRSVYVVGNEQDYHFKVLQLVLKRLGKSYADGVYHLSYGMVDLPSGKMKSREGTVVDADDLLSEMHETAEQITKELGKTEGFTEEQLQELYEQIGQGALKYYLLKVDPKKRLMFNPAESIDFQGNTGPFIQYTCARISSILRVADVTAVTKSEAVPLQASEKELINTLYRFPSVIDAASEAYSPALVANYVYEVAKAYNKFYHEHTILREEDTAIRNMRLQLCMLTKTVLKKSLNLLGIAAPERM
ncbi:MAG: arginine--tRNA ligase [Bacteroidia bacterium]